MIQVGESDTEGFQRSQGIFEGHAITRELEASQATNSSNISHVQRRTDYLVLTLYKTLTLP